MIYYFLLTLKIVKIIKLLLEQNGLVFSVGKLVSRGITASAP